MYTLEQQNRLENLDQLLADVAKTTIKSAEEYEQIRQIRDMLLQAHSVTDSVKVQDRSLDCLAVLREKLRAYEDGPAYDSNGRPI